MQCSTCGNALPTGAMFCTNCGAKIYNQGSPESQSAGSPEIQPTLPASSTFGTPPNAQPSNQSAVPPTAYGGPSYNGPQQYPNEAPPPPPPYPYGTPSTPPGTYGTPPSYGAPYSPPPGSFVPPVQQPPTPRKGPGVGLIIGLVVLVLLVVVGGFLAIRAATGGSTTNTVTPTPTSSSSTSITPTPAVTPTTGETLPSSAQVDSAAAAIITQAQTASAIDSNAFPTKLTSNFTVGQTVYVTFNLNTNGQSGYVEAKFFVDSNYVKNSILTVKPSYDHGYFSIPYNVATTGTIGLYWCTQSDCSDAKLATFVTFNVA